MIDSGVSRLVNLAVLLALSVTGLAACGSSSAPDSPPTSVTTVEGEDALRQQAQQYLDSLVGSSPCDDIWKLVVSDGEDQADFCVALQDYRTEVKSLRLGEVTDSAEDYTVFAVRVDYLDGSPPVLDSEVEIDVVNGKPKVAAGLP